MRVAFDLDGVIAQMDLALLKSIEHDPVQTEIYYRTRNVLLNPYDFLGPDDTGFIVTHRGLRWKEITEHWLSAKRIYLETFYSRERLWNPDTPWGPVSAAGVKAKILRSVRADLYIDDDPEEAAALRELGIPVLIYGAIPPTRSNWREEEL